MKRTSATFAMMMGLLAFSTQTQAETGPKRLGLHTSKHSIHITCNDNNGHSDYAEDCTYQAWNKPKGIGEGRPDFEIKGGSFQMVRYPSCHFWSYNFLKGDTGIDIAVLTYANWLEGKDHHPECDWSLEKHADGMLEVSVKGKRKAVYAIHLP